MCEIDGNQILVEPLLNRAAGQLVVAYNKLLERLKASGIYPKLQYLDNEAPEELKPQAIKDAKIEYQLSTPYVHRANIAERAIQRF
jgi:hypothetical protein